MFKTRLTNYRRPRCITVSLHGDVTTLAVSMAGRQTWIFYDVHIYKCRYINVGIYLKVGIYTIGR